MNIEYINHFEESKHNVMNIVNSKFPREVQGDMTTKYNIAPG